MTIKSSLMFAKSLIFPRTQKKSSARRSFFGAMLCIGLSIIPLIVVLSVTNGMIDGMTERIIGLSSSNIQAYVSPSIPQVATAQAFNEYSSSLKNVNGVLNTYPELGITALAAGKSNRSGAQIRAMDKMIFSKNKSFSKLFDVIEGSIEEYENQDPESGKKAIIGKKLAENINVKAGDTIKIITTKSLNGKMSPKLTTFKVAAIVSSGYQELDALWLFIPLEAAYKYTSIKNSNFTIMIETEDPFDSNLVKIQRDLKKTYGRYANYYRWDQIHAAEFENFSSTKVMLLFIMLMIVLVASINVSSAIVMLVMERQKEIAILKSIGASPSGITFSFLVTGMACGIGGVLIGLPIGILGSVFANQIMIFIEYLVNFVSKIGNLIMGVSASEISKIRLMDPAYYLQEIPINLPTSQIILICLATILLSVVVCVVPAIKAGKEKPLEILRKN